jgi:putative restriction endonuclease
VLDWRPFEAMPSSLPSADDEMPVRLAAFRRLHELTRLHGPEVDWNLIKEGFSFQGDTYLFATRAKGIFRPRHMHGSALSIKTTVPRGTREARYEDTTEDPYRGVYTYRFQGGDPENHDNQLLARAYRQQTPLIYFLGTGPGRYKPLWPMYIAHFDPKALKCTVVKLDEDELSWLEGSQLAVAEGGPESIRRQYVTVQAKKRLHQALFRAMVLPAYGRRCAVCLLPHEPLLHAAHILPDSDELGEASVHNGLALCLLHHGAFDADLMGIHPEGRIELSSVLRETRDVPMSECAFHAFAGSSIHKPARREFWPSPQFLEKRYHRFLQSTG